MVGNIDPRSPGMECFAGEQRGENFFLYNAIGELLSDNGFGVLSPRANWWDSDDLKEIIVRENVFKYQADTLLQIEARVIAVADILGDWREEIITSLPGDHWDKIIWLIKQVNQGKPRPSNHTKIYGGGYLYFGTGGLEDGIERFWRNLLAGSASSRFHRPDAGNGLNEKARASIRAARILENTIKLWDVEPHMELLVDRQPNEAYLAAIPGEQYALYFTYGGSVGLDLSNAPGTFDVRWISITEGVLAREATIEGGEIVTVTAPFKGGWVAAIRLAGN